MRLLLAGALLAMAGQAEAQAATITGKVTSESGMPLGGANVYINDLSLTTLSTPLGIFTFTVPAAKVRGQTVNVRVRVIPYRPQVQSVRLTAGDHVVTFQLQKDSLSVVERVANIEGAARALASRPGQGSPVPGQADPFARFLFPPELVMQHQGALELQESQREALQNAIQEAQSQTLKMQWALSGEGEKLTKLLQADTLIEKDVLAQVDRILMTEREIKRAQMTLMIRIRNTLTPAQQERLRQARGQREDER